MHTFSKEFTFSRDLPRAFSSDLPTIQYMTTRGKLLHRLKDRATFFVVCILCLKHAHGATRTEMSQRRTSPWMVLSDRCM